MNANIDNVLSRLDKVRPNGRDRWIARCPAHQDRGPSLSIRQAADGKILLNCFAGCSAQDVTDTIGLELRDLFPKEGRPELIDARKRAQLLKERSGCQLLVLIGDGMKERQEPMMAKDEQDYKAAKRLIAEIDLQLSGSNRYVKRR